MAIYHLSVKAISRSAGRSATAAAAYRAAERVVDMRTGEIFDFTRKAGVEHAQIVMPLGSEWMPTREELWNAAEVAERRKDACTSREHEVALPLELDAAQRLALIRTYSQDLAERHGCAVDFAIHQPRADAPAGEENWHAHVLMTTRQIDRQGLGQKCEREKAGRDRKADLQAERLRWAEFVNAALADADLAVRVDHRSLVDQRAAAEQKGKHDEARRLARTATRHRGPVEDGMQRRGRRSRRAADREQQSREARHAQADARHESIIAGQEAEQVARELRSLKRRRRVTRPPNRIEGEQRRAPMVDFLTREEQRGRILYRWPNGSAAVVDRGDSLSVPRATDARLRAAAELAKAKGWAAVSLTGDDNFKRRAARELFEKGITVTNPELQTYMQQLQTERRAAELPTNPRAIGEAARQADQIISADQAARERARKANPDLYKNARETQQQLNKLKANKMDDLPEWQLQQMFVDSIVNPLRDEAEQLDAEIENLDRQISVLQGGSMMKRLFTRSQSSQLQDRRAAAARRAAALRKQADEREAAARAMKHPKIRTAYNNFLAREHARLNEEERRADETARKLHERIRNVEHQEGADPAKRRAAEERAAQLTQKILTLEVDDRAAAEAARAGRDLAREQAREAEERQKREQDERDRLAAALRPQQKPKTRSKGMSL